jgi:hypothetical protein
MANLEVRVSKLEKMAPAIDDERFEAEYQSLLDRLTPMQRSRVQEIVRDLSEGTITEIDSEPLLRAALEN